VASIARSHNGATPLSITAYIYARVSTDEQAAKGYSLPTQLDACRAYATERGYQVAGEFTDDYTGTETERPGLSALYDALRGRSDRPGAIVVIVYDIDRLGRGTTTLAIVEHTLERLGARVEFVRGQEYQGPEGELLKAIKMALSGYENALRAERIRRGMRGRVQAGHPLAVAGRVPYGYRYVSADSTSTAGAKRGHYELDPAAAEVVRHIYRWLIDERMTATAIANRLSQLGIPTAGDQNPAVAKKAGYARWAPQTVIAIVKNPVYKGTWLFGRMRRVRRTGAQAERLKTRHVQVPTPEAEWVAAPVPAIVDEATWQRAQERLQENQERARRNTRRQYLLRGLLVCPPPCNHRWHGRLVAAVQAVYYQCGSSGTHLHDRCPNRFTLRADVVEPAVWHYVTAELLDPDRLEAEVRRQQRAAAQEAQATAERLAATEAAIAEVDRKLSALLAKELDGYPGEVIARHRRDLLAQRQELLAERDRHAARVAAETISEDTVTTVRQLAQAVQDALPHLTFAERQQLLHVLRLRITVVGRDRVHVDGLLTPRVLDLTRPIPVATTWSYSC
jgi:site-specific DNA recombinase